MSITTGPFRTADVPASTQSLYGLDRVNFFLAAILAGFGPYVAAYLAGQKWTQTDIGLVLTASSVAGLLSQVPGGELLDKIRSKRAVVAVGVGVVALSALVIAIRPTFPLVSIGLVLQGVTGGFLGPAIAAISLGLVGYSALAERLGRNQRFASTGALIGAGLMGLVGYLHSYQAIFLVAAALGLPLFAALSWIRAADIHFGQSCGAPDHHGTEQPARIRRPALWLDPRLLVFSVCLFLFQLANASVLPLAGEALVHASPTGSSLILSALIVVPLIIVALMAPWAGRQAQSWGRRPLLVIGFAALPIRALGFAVISDPLLLVGIQLLDGISATVLGVLTALVIADITSGTGRFNLAQGIVGTASGIGASLSTTLSGLVAERLGSGAGFSCIAAIALLATFVVLFLMPETRPQTERSGGTSPSGQPRRRSGSNSHNGVHHDVQSSSRSAPDIHSPGSDDPDQRVGRADNWPSERGLFFRDTRVISSWAIYANGETWDLLNGGALTYYASRIFLTNRAFSTENGAIPARTLGLIIGRWIGGGVHEDIEVTNNSVDSIRFQLEIAIRSDFADLFEVKSNRIVRRGRITTEWSHARQRLRATYRNRDFARAVAISMAQSSSKAAYANGRLSFDIELGPGERWHTCLLYTMEDGAARLSPPGDCVEDCEKSPHAEALAEWLERVVKIRTSNEEFYRMFRRALEDMAALRLPINATDRDAFMPAAGLPWFIAPFGRDSLIVSLQNILIYPHFARGALDFLGSLQAEEDDPYRDAEPGKILHELRRGELAHFKLVPHTPYYGTADATPLYLVTLHAAWRATGDKALLKRHLEFVEGCLSWIDDSGDRDGDGFQEYQTRSPVGYENMSWKDSGDAIVYPDGSLVKGPKALCELQGYVYDAWIRIAEVFDALGKPDRAGKLRAKAAALFEHFNAAFWDDELGFYALALDGEKRKVLTIASNAGHCLWSGIVPPERAKKVRDRLMASDMWTGWGIRTLSDTNPAFNPYNYQTGSVWPHDNAIIAMGFKRYGFGAEAAQIAHDISKAASYFQMNKLPELYTAFRRNETTFPIQYIGANVPQAWAAGSAFMFTQAMLGFLPDAPRNKLYVDPRLPDWLPDLTIQDLRIGRHKLAIRFWRQGEETYFQVISGDSSIVERREYTSKVSPPTHISAPICQS